MCSAQVVDGETREDGQHQCACTQQVELGATFDAREFFTIGQRGVIGMPAQSAESDRLSACCSGGFSRANGTVLDVALVETEAEKFGFVQRPGVVSAGTCCDPADDFLVANEKGKAVLDFECCNSVPADYDGFERIHNGDTLVANDELRSNEEQPSAGADCCTPNPSARMLPIRSNHDTANNENNCCQSDAAPWSENLRVSHASIIAGEN